MKQSAMAIALLSVSLCTSAALAEGPRNERMPRQLEMMRARGDIVDRSYERAERQRTVERPLRIEQEAPSRPSHGAERIRCADTGSDCATRVVRTPREVSERAAAARPRAAAGQPTTRMNSKAEARTNCGDTDQCGASSARSQRLWAQRSTLTGRTAAGAPAAQQRGHGQREAPQTSCDDSGECSMSSKDAQKFWAEQAIKAGAKSPSQISSERAARARNVAERLERQSAERKAHLAPHQD